MTKKKAAKKVARKRATKEEFPGQGPISLKEAYKILGPASFAFWLLACEEKGTEGLHGRVNLAKVFGRSTRRTADVVNDLAEKGFMEIKSNGPFERTLFVITRYPLINRQTYFVVE